MARKLREVKERIDLDADGIVSGAIQDVIHDRPHEVHRERAAEVCGFKDPALLPAFETVAELIAFVVSVRAAAGDDKQLATILDRFSPKAARTQVDVNAGNGAGAPVSSSNPEEKQAAEDYISRLRSV